jgi:predicted nucleic acid-binding protein
VGFAWVLLLAVLRIALERGATLASCDNYFRRFGGLRRLDPLAEGRG